MPKTALKRLIKDSVIGGKREAMIANGQLHQWHISGRPLPGPDALKQQIVRQYAARFQTQTLIETGTFMGRMVWAMRRTFDTIYSIELDRALYEAAAQRFSPYKHISILSGDSGEVLPTILSTLIGPTLFWLDGHYSGEITAKGTAITPIMMELRHIFAHPIEDHVLLIDDARLFNGEDDYPTLDSIRDFVQANRPGWVIQVKHDVIRIHKPK